jgi:hypothetical protein
MVVCDARIAEMNISLTNVQLRISKMKTDMTTFDDTDIWYRGTHNPTYDPDEIDTPL